MADLTTVLLAVLIGTLAAIVYTLRVVAIMDRKITLLCQRQGVNLKDIEKR